MTNLEPLQNSCVRLPKLVKLNAPTNLLVAEVRILIGLALEAVENSLGKDLHKQRELRQQGPHPEKPDNKPPNEPD